MKHGHRILRLLDRLKGANIVRVATLMGAMILLAHWVACIWWVMARNLQGIKMDWSFACYFAALSHIFVIYSSLAMILLPTGWHVSSESWGFKLASSGEKQSIFCMSTRAVRSKCNFSIFLISHFYHPGYYPAGPLGGIGLVNYGASIWFYGVNNWALTNVRM